jgi:hypothetical protein
MSRLAQEIREERKKIRDAMARGDAPEGARLKELKAKFEAEKKRLRAIKQGEEAVPRTRYQSRFGTEEVQDIGNGMDIYDARQQKGNKGGTTRAWND